MVTIFSDIISKRLSYVVSLIFEDRGIPYQILNDPDIFVDSEGVKIVYSDYPFDKSYPTISPANLLFEEDIRQHYLSRVEWEGEETISFDGRVDPIASIFYIITGYDEYLSEETDEHDRYPGKSSLVYNYGWIDKLMIERWSERVISFIELQSKEEISKESIPFKIIPTFDIDNVYAYKLKEGTRKWMSISRDLLRFDKSRLRERRNVLKVGLKDPYDTYDYIFSLINEGYEVKLFWLLGDYGTFDRNVHHENRYHRSLIHRFSERCKIGLHPSYQSNDSRSTLVKEKLRLEEIIDSEVENSRQHFLKINLPHTYEKLISCGFLNDYTMGFADTPGFRAGIARTYLWYNLKKDQITTLSVHPFTYMDGTLNEYMKLTVQEAIDTVDKLKSEVKRYGGDFISIWHNETIGDYGKWKGWRTVLEHSLKS
jgi:hypothetical protein